MRIRKTIATFFLVTVCSAFPLQAQTVRQPIYPKGPVRERPKLCNGGWSGIVTYKKTLNESLHTDEPLPGRIPPDKNRIKIDRTRDFLYEGKAVVESTDPVHPVVGTKASLRDVIREKSQQKEWDQCHAFENPHSFVVDGTNDETTEATVEGPAESFHLQVNDQLHTYSFGLDFPKAEGKYHQDETQKRSGFCGPRTNEGYDRKKDRAHNEPVQGFTIDNRKIDLEQPDLLTGTYTWGDDGKGAVRTFVYTVTWYFTRCPGKLLITDLKFEHPKFPDWDNWKEFDPFLDGTFDGNRVRITAKILNFSSETKYADLKITEDQEPPAPGYQKPPDIPIPAGELSVRVEPGELRDVELIWDTEGQSWNDIGQPHSSHFIKAEAFENGAKVSTKMELLRISPKPIVAVHGLWSSPNAFGSYQNVLTEESNGRWLAYVVGEKPQYGKLSTGGEFMSADKTGSVFQNAEEVARYVRYAQEDSNAWHVDMVGHDLGGLIARAYIHKLMPELPDHRPLVKHLMMLGTPNAGAPCADQMSLKFALFGDHVQALDELQPERVALFNQFVTNRRGVKFSALAGNSVPLTCGGYAWNDGLVPVESAIFGISDHAYSNDFHDKLTDARNARMFIRPHVITGPKGTYPIPVISDPNDWNRWNGNKDHWITIDGGGGFMSYNYSDQIGGLLAGIFTASLPHRGGPRVDDTDVTPGDAPSTFSHEVKLAPGQSLTVDVPVKSGNGFGVSFLADPKVSATLTDDKGTIRDTNLAGSLESRLLFRPLFNARPVQDSVWKLKLENTSQTEQIVLVSGWERIDRSSLVVWAEKSSATGVVALKARLLSSTASGTKVTARVSGIADEIELLDDGTHDDGRAADGVYGGHTGKLPSGYYTVEGRAERNGLSATAASAFEISNSAKPATRSSADVAKPVTVRPGPARKH